MLTYEQLLKWGEAQLKEAAIEEYRSDAWILFQYITKMSRTSYYMKNKEPAASGERESYEGVIRIRKGHKPVQYITKEQEFMGYPFYVDSSVLIPRQDTEVLLEQVLLYVKDQDHILDMCTGSGCILISLMRSFLETKKDAFLTGTGVDISSEALAVANKNASLLEEFHTQCEVKFVKSSLFEDVKEERYDIIVSNPPYIKSEEVRTLMPEVKDFEPMLALDGMEDGLYFYDQIVQTLPKFLKPGGRIFFEIGCDQGEAVRQMLLDAAFEEVEVIKDLAGLDRVVKGRYTAMEL